MLSDLMIRLRSLFRRDTVDGELDEEDEPFQVEEDEE